MPETDAADVHPSNVEQARGWDGEGGAYWAAHADRLDRSLARYRRPFSDAAAIDTAARVLDVGCGTGQTTRDAARAAGAGSVLGVDLSSRMLEEARERAAREGVGNVRFERADAQVHPFAAGSFDVAISRNGAMFFGDPVAAFANIARALRPAGRLVLQAWQPMARNEWLSTFRSVLSGGRDVPMPPPDAPGPFSLGDPVRVRALLAAAGLADPYLEAVAEPLYCGADADDAEAFVLGQFGWLLDGLDEPARARALDALRVSVEAHLTTDGVQYGAAAWIITTHRNRS